MRRNVSQHYLTGILEFQARTKEGGGSSPLVHTHTYVWGCGRGCVVCVYIPLQYLWHSAHGELCKSDNIKYKII
jgi:hypothetical protein